MGTRMIIRAFEGQLLGPGATHHDINAAPSLPAAVIPFVDGDRQQT